MEIFFVSSLCLSLFLVTLSIYLILYKKRPTLPGQLPPGRSGWPLIGESLQFLSGGWKGHPERFIFDRMARYSVIFRSHLFGERTAVFCGAAGNKFLFSNENKLVQIWWPSCFEKVLGTSTKDEHQIMNMFPDLLKPEALQKYIGIMDEIVQRHFELSWESKDKVKVFPLSKNYTFWIASRLFLSVDDPAEVAKLIEPFSALNSGLFSIPIELPGTAYNKALKASKKIRKMLLAFIKQRKIDLAERKASETQDILSQLLKSDENGKFMNVLDIANRIIGLLVAGHDTASGACTSIVKFLAELPEIYEGVYMGFYVFTGPKIVNPILTSVLQMEIAKSKSPGENLNWDDIQKMRYSWNVAREAMRLLPPLQGSFREALTDFIYNGFSIPKGWKLYWNVYSTHLNPECFPRPENFDPSRFEGSGPAPYTFLPFGGGPRMCTGKEYARLEILVFMHNLVKRFRWEKIIPDEKIIVDPMPFPAKGLPIKLYRYKA